MRAGRDTLHPRHILTIGSRPCIAGAITATQQSVHKRRISVAVFPTMGFSMPISKGNNGRKVMVTRRQVSHPLIESAVGFGARRQWIAREFSYKIPPINAITALINKDKGLTRARRDSEVADFRQF